MSIAQGSDQSRIWGGCCFPGHNLHLDAPAADGEWDIDFAQVLVQLLCGQVQEFGKVTKGEM